MRDSCAAAADGIARVFRKYEGELTDEVDANGRPVRVTSRSFARHVGVPVKTLKAWVERSVNDDVAIVTELMADREVVRAYRKKALS